MEVAEQLVYYSASENKLFLVWKTKPYLYHGVVRATQYRIYCEEGIYFHMLFDDPVLWWFSEPDGENSIISIEWDLIGEF